MIFLLFAILFIMMFIAYILTEKDILSPCIIVCAMFIFSSFICILNISNWNVNLEPFTVLIIIIGIVSFGIGELISRVIINKIFIIKHKNTLTLPNSSKRFDICISWMIIIYIFMLITTILYFKEIYRISLIGGSDGSYELMLKYARNAMTGSIQELSQSKILAHARVISLCLAYLFVFIFIYNFIFFKFKFKDIKYIIPLIIYCAIALLSTGRTEFIYLLVVILLTSFIFLKKKNNWCYKYDFKLLFISIIVIISFLILFYFLGTFTGKKSLLSLRDTVSIYAGSSIVAFDIYLENPIPKSQYFGKETLFGVYSFLRKFGLDMPIFIKPLEFVEWQNGATNIYTSFRRYIQDYSYIGLIIIQLFLGFIYGGGMAYIKKSNKISLHILLYSMFFFPVIECSIEERFLSNIVSTGTVYQISYMVILYYFFIVRKTKVHFSFKI